MIYYWSLMRFKFSLRIHRILEPEAHWLTLAAKTFKPGHARACESVSSLLARAHRFAHYSTTQPALERSSTHVRTQTRVHTLICIHIHTHTHRILFLRYPSRHSEENETISLHKCSHLRMSQLENRLRVCVSSTVCCNETAVVSIACSRTIVRQIASLRADLIVRLMSASRQPVALAVGRAWLPSETGDSLPPEPIGDFVDPFQHSRRTWYEHVTRAPN